MRQQSRQSILQQIAGTHYCQRRFLQGISNRVGFV